MDFSNLTKYLENLDTNMQHDELSDDVRHLGNLTLEDIAKLLNKILDKPKNILYDCSALGV